MNPGDHDIRAEKDGKRSTTRSVHLSAGAKLSLELIVDDGSVKVAPPPASPVQSPGANGGLQASPPATSDTSSLKVPLLVSGAVLTLGGSTVGTVFLLKSNSASDDAETAFERAVASSPGVDPSSACAIKDRASACDEAETRVADQRKYRNVAVGAFIGTGVVAAATAAAWWLWPDHKGTATARPGVSPLFGPGFAGGVVSGSF